MSDKLYKCPECSKTDNGYNWDKATQEFCGIDRIISINRGGFGEFFICPSCDSQVDWNMIEVIEPVKNKCEYCEVDVDDRKMIFIIETDYVDYEIYVDGNNNLSSDFPFGKKINYCLMCGRKL